MEGGSMLRRIGIFTLMALIISLAAPAARPAAAAANPAAAPRLVVFEGFYNPV